MCSTCAATVRGERTTVRDLTVRATLDDQRQHLELPRREAVQSFLLPLESALFVFFGQRLLGGTLTEEQQIQDAGWLSGIYIIGGLAFLLAGLAFLMIVIIPRLRERSLVAQRQDHALRAPEGSGRSANQAAPKRPHRDRPVGPAAQGCQ
jgi:hypothetical protein